MILMSSYVSVSYMLCNMVLTISFIPAGINTQILHQLKLLNIKAL